MIIPGLNQLHYLPQHVTLKSKACANINSTVLSYWLKNSKNKQHDSNSFAQLASTIRAKYYIKLTQDQSQFAANHRIGPCCISEDRTQQGDRLLFRSGAVV